MMKLNGNQKGFSLIELMVVVGIIGILAAIAVPNFQKFQAKSRQTEAKANLGGIYTAEKAFFAEWNMYFGAFRHIGYAPEGNLRYRVGFTAGGTMPANMGYSGPNCTDTALACAAGADAVRAIVSDTYCPTTTGTPSVCNELAAFATAIPAATIPAGGLTFTAAASGNIDSDAASDQWTIDHTKNLVNTISDLAADI